MFVPAALTILTTGTVQVAPAKSSVEVLNVCVSHYELYGAKNRPLAVLVELLVKYHQQVLSGYDSNTAFINCQQQLIRGVRPCSLY